MTRARDFADVISGQHDLPSGALDNAIAFPSGTLMLFQQTSAPTGWTKQTTHNNKALRIVSGTAGSGGTTAFTSALGTPTVTGTISTSIANTTAGGSIANTTAGGSVGNASLATNQIPSHLHGITFYNNNGNTAFNPYGSASSSAFNYNTGSTGGGAAHGHTFTGTAHNHTFTGTAHNHTATSTLSSSTAAIDVQYVDIIIASKD